ncbi:hypothetical protein INT47_002304 [Mucor saturninus]|uniref:Uncharacterized protein n=1 Tax=Mucor saturninus TaxID=64648 RepID=A0A8H7UYF3_9FUNG|nr:hypothetical protein INT47_002304 [Mucor saturninus]
MYHLRKEYLKIKQTDILEGLMLVCHETKKRLADAIVALGESEIPEAVKNPVKSHIEGSILLNDAYHAKYEESAALNPFYRHAPPLQMLGYVIITWRRSSITKQPAH